MNSPEDQKIVDQLQQAPPESAPECKAWNDAWDSFIGKHYERLERIVAYKFQYSLDWSEVEDVIQDGLVKFMNVGLDLFDISKGKGDHVLFSYLRTIVIRTGIDHARRKGGQPSHSVPEYLTDKKAQESQEEKEDREALAVALSRLDENQQRLWDRLCEGVPVEEIARRSGASRAKVYRNRAALIEALSSQLQDDPPSPPSRT